MPRDLFEGNAPRDLFGGRPPENPSAPASPEGIQWGAIAGDIGSGIANIPAAILSTLLSAPKLIEEIGGLGGQSAKRGLQNAFLGLAKGGHGLLNTPSNIANYLGRRGVISEETAGMIPRQSDEAFQGSEWLLGNPQAGDTLIQGLTEFAPSLVAGGPAKSAALYAVGQGENPITAAGSVKLATHLGGAAKKAYQKGPVAGLGYLLTGENKALSEAGRLYGNIEKTLEKAGESSNLRVPNVNWDELGKIIPKKNQGELAGLREIKKLVESGTYQNLNQAQSKIAAWGRELEKRSRRGGQTHTKKINLLEHEEHRLHGSLYDKFMEIDPELARQYQQANELYAKGIKKDQKIQKAVKSVGKDVLSGTKLGILANILKGK